MTRIPEKMLFLILMIIAGSMPGNSRDLELQYREIRNQSTICHTFRIDRQGTRRMVHLVSRETGHKIRQTFLVESDWDTRVWTYDDTLRNTRITARRREGTIVLEGLHQGDRINRKFEIGNGFWNQLFHIGLGPFAADGETVGFFHAIGTSGIGDMKIARFRATGEGREVINLDSEPRDAIHITISLAGIRSVLWTGHYWFEKDSGLFLRYLNRPHEPDRGNRMVLVNRTITRDGKAEEN